ncbi:MAG: DinB family protein [Chloroflexota bacterium]|nr:DinB family protein [Chloroflexota bacterium]
MNSKQPVVDLVQYNRWANTVLLDLIARAPADGLDVIQPGMYASVREILAHLTGVERNFLRAIRGQSIERLRERSIDELQPMLRSLGPEFLTVLDGERDLKRPVHIPWLDGGVDIPLSDAVLQAVTHSIQHRADIIGQLGREGVQSPTMDYVRWVLNGRPAVSGP